MLAAPFVQGFAAEVPDRAALEQALVGLVEAARAAWPSLTLEAPTFVAYLAQRVEPGPALVARLERLHVGDLYLACACVQGDEAAIERFSRRVMAAADLALRRIGCDPTAADDVKQELRVRLLVGEGARSPKILTYSGRGTLSGWLQVIAVRAAQKALKRRGRRAAARRALIDLADPGHDQELAHLKRLYRLEFKQAFERALVALSSRDRNTVRYHYLEGLKIEQIGAIYGVHRATVARWLERIRQRLLEATRDGMIQALQIQQSEFESIMRLIESQLEASVVQYLGSESE